MTRTYTFRHELFIAVEATSAKEARIIAKEIERAISARLPTGARLSMSNVLQR